MLQADAMLILIAALLAQGPTPAPKADEVLKKIESTPGLKEQDKPFEIAVSLGKLYLGQGRYPDAAQYLGQATQKAEAARRFFKQLGKSDAALAIPAECTPGPEKNLELLLTLAKAKAAAQSTLQAKGCARAALLPLLEVDVLWGHALYLSGNSDGALKAYSQAVDTFSENLEARYARGALILDTKGDDVKLLQSAKVDLDLVVAAQPASPRLKSATSLLKRTEEALAAGGLSKIAPTVVAAAQPSGPPALTPQMMEAFQNTPRTPQMEAKFEKLIVDAETSLSKGEFQLALDNYKQVMPFQPDNARLRAGMAQTLFGLKKPMAERVWSVASQNPEAIDALGDRLKALGDETGAKAVWTRLSETVPAYAPKLKEKL